MDFDWQWILIALPLAFGLGWLASRIDLRQWRRSDTQARKAYFSGLNLLLNEQTDKAVDAFIEAVQADPDTSELHFALGNLFRRRGEFERAVRVHQHLLQRADLSLADRQRAQHGLALDFVKAGLLDRAEDAFKALQGSPYDSEAKLARLSLHERSRDWPLAIALAQSLEQAGAGSFAQRIAHYHCELAQEAELRGDAAAVDGEITAALAAAPDSARALALKAQRLARLGSDHSVAAMAAWTELGQRHPEALSRLAMEFAASAQAANQTAMAREALLRLFAQQPGIDTVRALALLDGSTVATTPQLMALLGQLPSLSAVLELLDAPRAQWPDAARPRMRDAVAQAARSQQRYRCAACGFESQRHFWQCPGCLSWDSFPPQRIEEQ